MQKLCNQIIEEQFIVEVTFHIIIAIVEETEKKI